MSASTPVENRTISPRRLHRHDYDSRGYPTGSGRFGSGTEGALSDSTATAYASQSSPPSFLQTLLQQARGERPPMFQRPGSRHARQVHHGQASSSHDPRRLPTPPALRRQLSRTSQPFPASPPQPINTHSDLDSPDDPSSSRPQVATTMPPTRRVSKRTILSSSESPPPSSATKRQKRPPGRRGSTTTNAEPQNPAQHPSSSNNSRRSRIIDIDAVDLADDSSSNALGDTLQKQRQEQIKAQEGASDKPIRLSNLKCVICLDNPTDLTATICGHLFCHTCLLEALIASENRSGPGETKRSQCPVCRKAIRRTKDNDVIPLLIKKARATQPRGKKRVGA